MSKTILRALAIGAVALSFVFPGEASSDEVCEAWETADCVGVCIPATWVGDGVCDDGSAGVDFMCDAHGFDGGDCEDACAPGRVMDCAGECQPASWVADGVCDDGPGGEGGGDFMCEAFGFDGGDCFRPDAELEPCPVGQQRDCDGVCGWTSWHGDGICDDGSYGIDYDCAAFDGDGGDCGVNDGIVCPPDELWTCLGD